MNLQIPPVFLCYLFGNCQSQAGAARFRGEKGIENFTYHFFGNSLAVVLDEDMNPRIHFSRFNRYRAFILLHGFKGIYHQIQQYLPDLVAVTVGRRKIFGEPHAHGNKIFAGLLLQKEDGFPHQLVDVGRFGRRLQRFGEVEQGKGELIDAFNLICNDLDKFLDKLALVIFAYITCSSPDGVERILDFVG